jgi:GMP synthase-like glutamine amidotransferase
LVFQHIAVEHPGFFRDLMAADGSRWDVVELDRGDPIPTALSTYDALFVMGGPMDVWDEATLPWLTAEKRAIQEWVLHGRRPFLGVCLGHQLLAEAVGGSVGRMARPEVGVCEVQLTPDGGRDPLLKGVAERFSSLQWHGAEVAHLPKDAVVSAINADGVIEAFRYGDRAFGLQFHVETTADTVREWGSVPAYEASLAAVKGPNGLEDLDRAAAASLPNFQALARRIYANFAAIVADAAPADL